MSDHLPPNESKIAQELLREDVMEVMASLSDMQKRVLWLRFGLDDGRVRTLEEVGLQLNITRERTRQVEREALRMLRRGLPQRCSFCSAECPAAKRLFKGQAAKICLNCIQEISDFFQREQPNPSTHNHVCYFCNAEQSEAGHLYLTPNANICPTCVKKFSDQA